MAIRIIVIMLIVIVPSAGARIWHVPAEAPTVQAGIDSAAGGDTVLVDPGTYPENVSFLGKPVLLGSWFITTGDTAYIDSTVLDPNGSVYGSVVSFTNGESPFSVISGFTIRGGQALRGAGVYCYESYPTIQHNTITSNQSDQDGAGIYAYHGGPSILDNRISENTSDGGSGGGIGAVNSAPTISRNRILLNSAGEGGGIGCTGCDPIITDNIIAYNNINVYGGGGIISRECGSVITGNKVYGNVSADVGGGVMF